MKFPATDIEYAMQSEIDQLKVRIQELEQELTATKASYEQYIIDAAANINSLRDDRDNWRAKAGG